MHSFLADLMDVFDPLLEAHAATLHLQSPNEIVDEEDVSDAREEEECDHERDLTAHEPEDEQAIHGHEHGHEDMQHEEDGASVFAYTEPGITSMTAMIANKAQLQTNVPTEHDSAYTEDAGSGTSTSLEDTDEEPVQSSRWTFDDCTD